MRHHLDQLALIDEYKILIDPRIAGYGPMLYRGVLPSTLQLDLV
jgi:hypothetical protein